MKPIQLRQAKPMQRYHSVANDPPRLLDAEKRWERLELELLTAQFLAKGGVIQPVNPKA